MFGLALLITIKQIPKILGIEAHGDTALALVRDMLPHVREADLLTLAVGAGGIAVMIVLERRLPRVPAALVVLLGSIAVSVAFGLEAQGVKVVGELPAGLAGPSLPGVGLEAVPQLLVGALGIALVAFAEAIGPAKEFAREHGGKIDPNRELIALGAANTGAGLFSGFPIGSSLSKSAANDRAGAKTPASLITAAAATALVALFLTPLFEPLPEATLGAIVDRRGGRDDEGRQDAAAVAVAARGVLARVDRPGGRPRHADPAGAGDRRHRLAGHAGLARQPGAPDLPRPGARRPGAGDLRTAPDAAIPGLLIVRPDEMLFFANVASVRDEIVEAVADADPRPSVVLLDLGLTPEVDVPVVEALEHLQQRLAGDGIELWLSDLRPDARDLLDRAGALAVIGPDRVYARVIDGILAFALRTPGAAERVAVLNDLLAFIRERETRPDVERGRRRAAGRLGGAALARAGGCGGARAAAAPLVTSAAARVRRRRLYACNGSACSSPGGPLSLVGTAATAGVMVTQAGDEGLESRRSRGTSHAVAGATQRA